MLVNLFFILLSALIGGLVAKYFKIPSLVGYILAGFFGGIIFSLEAATIQNIAELGVILLLFSVGLEVSFERMLNVGKVAIIGSILGIISFSAISFWLLTVLGNMTPNSALVLSLAFSLSSTALIVKIMSDGKEEGTIHSEIMTSWSLTQDIAVIPIVILLPMLTLQTNPSWVSIATGSILTTVLILGTVLLIGRLVAPYLTRLVAASNNREFLLLLAITLALGTASLVSLFGISAAFGAFLAGLVISKTQENHAIFSEVRPLRDIFSVIFFVSLGFLVTPIFILTHIFSILLLTIFILILKAVITFVLCVLLGIKGRTAISVSLGLDQVGEFAFVLFLIAQGLKIIPQDVASLGIATTLSTLLVSPFLFKGTNLFWNELKKLTANSHSLKKILINGHISNIKEEEKLQDHIIICGFGRMGKWIGKALKNLDVNFVAIDYNHKAIQKALLSGTKVIYGDASQKEILEHANIENSKAIIITVPDNIAQEEIIVLCQKNYPQVKIMARARSDSDMKKLSDLKIYKVIQPEFEAAISIVKSILVNSGHSKEDIARKTKSLRLSHSSV